jgi:hypothetical protein
MTRNCSLGWLTSSITMPYPASVRRSRVKTPKLSILRRRATPLLPYDRTASTRIRGGVGAHRYLRSVVPAAREFLHDKRLGTGDGRRLYLRDGSTVRLPAGHSSITATGRLRGECVLQTAPGLAGVVAHRRRGRWLEACRVRRTICGSS